MPQRCEGCGKKGATYGMEEDGKWQWCKACSESHEGAKNLRITFCKYCHKRWPNYGFPGEPADMCRGCAEKHPGTQNVRSKKCETCHTTEASFGMPEEGRRRWCLECAKSHPGSKNVSKKGCEDCDKPQPAFGIPPDTTARWCGPCSNDHPGAENVKSTKCVDCKKTQPTYGLIGGKVLWCRRCADKHKGAENLRGKKCEDCDKLIANFGMFLEDGKKGKVQWCANCSKNHPGSFDLRHNKCEDCHLLFPSWRVKGEKKLRWCTTCAADHENVEQAPSKKCEDCGVKSAHFCTKESRIARWCKACASKHSDAVDPSNCKCKKCGAKAYYNFVGQSPKFCSKHKKPQMARFPMKRCSIRRCRQLALWGIHNREHCEDHKEIEEFNLVEAKCISCGLLEILSETKRCSNCEPEIMKRFTKRKEMRILKLLEAHGLTYHSHDTIIKHGEFGDERPDFVFFCGTHIVILEVDEDQHRWRVKECEILRMKNISQFFGGLHVLWIRYNPDAFKLPTNETAKIKIAQREACLIQWIQWAIGHVPEEFAEVLYLFYNGCNMVQTQDDIKVLLEMNDSSLSSFGNFFGKDSCMKNQIVLPTPDHIQA